MDEVNEEVYSTIFNALRHGVRRNILRMLSLQELPFSAMEERLSLSSSHLTYHLDALKELVTKTDTGYKLSVFGQAAVEMIEKVEDPPQIQAKKTLQYKQATFILLAIAILTSGLFGYSQIQLGELRFNQTTQINEIKTLQEKLEIYEFQETQQAQWVHVVRRRNSTLPNMWIPFLDDEYCINKFLETTSEDGFEYWNVTIGPVKVGELIESEGKYIRTFSAYTMWLNSTVYWPYAGYITEDREIYYIRLD